MNRPKDGIRSTLRPAGRLVRIAAGLSSLVGPSGSAVAGEAADLGAEAVRLATQGESLSGDAVSLVGIALIGVIAISRRHRTR
jgi:hypothetical protein